MKKIVLLVVTILILAINQCYYLLSLQFKCTDKINNGRELNLYETVSALQTHTNLWLFGWIIDPATANMCFCKQFHITNPLIQFSIPEDSIVVEAKNKLKNNEEDRIRLTWKNYSTRASICLNGSYISRYSDETGDYYRYEINNDYKLGVISIHGITISETIFDYLENKGILSVNTIYKLQKMK